MFMGLQGITSEQTISVMYNNLTGITSKLTDRLFNVHGITEYYIRTVNHFNVQ